MRLFKLLVIKQSLGNKYECLSALRREATIPRIKLNFRRADEISNLFQYQHKWKQIFFVADPQTVNKTLRTGLKISDRYRDRDLRATIEKLFFVFSLFEALHWISGALFLCQPTMRNPHLHVLLCAMNSHGQQRNLLWKHDALSWWFRNHPGEGLGATIHRTSLLQSLRGWNFFTTSNSLNTGI